MGVVDAIELKTGQKRKTHEPAERLPGILLITVDYMDGSGIVLQQVILQEIGSLSYQISFAIKQGHLRPGIPAERFQHLWKIMAFDKCHCFSPLCRSVKFSVLLFLCRGYQIFYDYTIVNCIDKESLSQERCLVTFL
jgi:hypothetical protein